MYTNFAEYYLSQYPVQTKLFWFVLPPKEKECIAILHKPAHGSPYIQAHVYTDEVIVLPANVPFDSWHSISLVNLTPDLGGTKFLYGDDNITIANQVIRVVCLSPLYRKLSYVYNLLPPLALSRKEIWSGVTEPV